VQLRFDAAHSPSLPEDVRDRLLAQAAGQITVDGVLAIDARRYRTQSGNREDALERLVEIVRRAATPPKPRRATRTPKAAKERRLDSKRKLSERKRLRRDVPAGE